MRTGLDIRRATAEAILAEVARGIPAESRAAAAAPTLVVAGARDRGAVASLAAFERAQTAVAPGVGHQWNLEDPDLFNAALQAWLKREAVDGRLKRVKPEG